MCPSRQNAPVAASPASRRARRCPATHHRVRARYAPTPTAPSHRRAMLPLKHGRCGDGLGTRRRIADQQRARPRRQRQGDPRAALHRPRVDRRHAAVHRVPAGDAARHRQHHSRITRRIGQIVDEGDQPVADLALDIDQAGRIAAGPLQVRRDRQRAQRRTTSPAATTRAPAARATAIAFTTRASRAAASCSPHRVTAPCP